jgi:hypothetical protein
MWFFWSSFTKEEGRVVGVLVEEALLEELETLVQGDISNVYRTAKVTTQSSFVTLRPALW